MRWLKWTALGVLVTLALSIAGGLLAWRADRSAGAKRLAELEAALDLTDPGWRLDDLLAKRDAAVPVDDRNLTTLCREVAEKQPKSFDRWLGEHKDWLPTPELNERPAPDDVTSARVALADAEPAAKLARTVRTRPTGGWKLDVPANPISTLLPHLGWARSVAALLNADGVLAAHDGDSARALSASADILHLSRVVSDEPMCISQLVRSATDQIAVQVVERTLAWGQPPAAGLADLQAALLAEAAEARLIHGFRGERATMQQLFSKLDAGQLDLAEFAGQQGTLASKSGFWLYHRHLLNDRAYHLDYTSRLVEIAAKPAHEQSVEFDALEIPPQQPDRILSRALLPAYQKLIAAELRLLARLRSAAVGLACERFRQANNRWPADLAELKELLPTVPLDPYDGQPLRYRKLDNGVAVYAVGPDRQDDGGTLSYGKPEPGEDIGFRLWDVAARRQPAAE